jgi:hypothetical protein
VLKYINKDAYNYIILRILNEIFSLNSDKNIYYSLDGFSYYYNGVNSMGEFKYAEIEEYMNAKIDKNDDKCNNIIEKAKQKTSKSSVISLMTKKNFKDKTYKKLK